MQQQQIVNMKREIWEGESVRERLRARKISFLCERTKEKKWFGKVDHIIKIYYWILLKDWRAYRVIFRHIHWLLRVYSKTLYTVQYTVWSSLSMIIRESMRLLRRIQDIKMLNRLLKCIQCDIIIDEPKNWKKHKNTLRTRYIQHSCIMFRNRALIRFIRSFFRISSIDVVMICVGYSVERSKKKTNKILQICIAKCFDYVRRQQPNGVVIGVRETKQKERDWINYLHN